jgi:hypothetical protein
MTTAHVLTTLAVSRYRVRVTDPARAKGSPPVAKFCPECGANAEGMKFCAECGTPLHGDTAATTLSRNQQVAILEREIAALASPIRRVAHRYRRRRGRVVYPD